MSPEAPRRREVAPIRPTTTRSVARTIPTRSRITLPVGPRRDDSGACWTPARGARTLASFSTETAPRRLRGETNGTREPPPAPCHRRGRSASIEPTVHPRARTGHLIGTAFYKLLTGSHSPARRRAGTPRPGGVDMPHSCGLRRKCLRPGTSRRRVMCCVPVRTIPRLSAAGHALCFGSAPCHGPCRLTYRTLSARSPGAARLREMAAGRVARVRPGPTRGRDLDLDERAFHAVGIGDYQAWTWTSGSVPRAGSGEALAPWNAPRRNLVRHPLVARSARSPSMRTSGSSARRGRAR